MVIQAERRENFETDCSEEHILLKLDWWLFWAEKWKNWNWKSGGSQTEKVVPEPNLPLIAHGIP